MTSKTKVPIEKTASGIRSIAEALGVSVATVDRALHNRGRISEETRARVLRMVKEKGYRPNPAARDLRLNRRFRISVHFPTTIAAFFDSLRAGIKEGAVPFRPVLELEFHNYARSREHKQAKASIRGSIEAGVSGIITVPANTLQMADLVREANEKSIPTIYVSTDAPESGRLAAVTPHPFSCGAMAAEVLAASMKARDRIVILAGDLENLNQTEKIRGFRTMLAQIAPALSVAAVVEGRDDPNASFREVRRLFQTMPRIGGLYVSSANSISALTALRQIGRLNDIAVVTTDLFPELVPFIRDGSVKATVYQCPEMQGSIAIRTMYQYLTEGIVPPPSISVIPQLVMKSNLELYIRKATIRRE